MCVNAKYKQNEYHVLYFLKLCSVGIKHYEKYKQFCYQVKQINSITRNVCNINKYCKLNANKEMM